MEFWIWEWVGLEKTFLNIVSKEANLLRMSKDLQRRVVAPWFWCQSHTFSSSETADRILPPPITAERSFKGYGQERGTIELKIRNNQMGKEINVLYFEQLPWFVKPLLHTMKTEVIEDEFGESLPWLFCLTRSNQAECLYWLKGSSIFTSSSIRWEFSNRSFHGRSNPTNLELYQLPTFSTTRVISFDRSQPPNSSYKSNHLNLRVRESFLEVYGTSTWCSSRFRFTSCNHQSLGWRTSIWN